MWAIKGIDVLRSNHIGWSFLNLFTTHLFSYIIVNVSKKIKSNVLNVMFRQHLKQETRFFISSKSETGWNVWYYPRWDFKTQSAINLLSNFQLTVVNRIDLDITLNQSGHSAKICSQRHARKIVAAFSFFAAFVS